MDFFLLSLTQESIREGFIQSCNLPNQNFLYEDDKFEIYQQARYLYEISQYDDLSFPRTIKNITPKGSADAILHDSNNILNSVQFKFRSPDNLTIKTNSLLFEYYKYRYKTKILEFGYADENTFKNQIKSLPNYFIPNKNNFLNNDNNFVKSFKLDENIIEFVDYSKFFNLMNTNNDDYNTYVNALSKYKFRYNPKMSINMLKIYIDIVKRI